MTSTKPSSAARRIARLVTDERDPRWVKVILEGSKRAVARLPRESLTELRIDEGRAWTAAVQKRVGGFVAHRQAREAALGLLAKSSHNTATMVRKLETLGFERSVVERTAAELSLDGWLDDDTHAETRARSLNRRRPGLSEEAAAGLLEADGIDARRASREARRIANDTVSRRSALEMAKRTILRRGTRSALSIAGSLARRGIDQEIIRDALAANGVTIDE
ncbi:MAG: hypothetical protein EXS03_00015 [Phycisphaerales bacterium]|nr:hypothetical protein [Phycisphaerales bacterium]